MARYTFMEDGHVSRTELGVFSHLYYEHDIIAGHENSNHPYFCKGVSSFGRSRNPKKNGTHQEEKRFRNLRDFLEHEKEEHKIDIEANTGVSNKRVIHI